jgi:hypothetical protein
MWKIGTRKIGGVNEGEGLSGFPGPGFLLAKAGSELHQCLFPLNTANHIA